MVRATSTTKGAPMSNHMFVGADVHKATTTIAVRDARGRFVSEMTCATDAETLVSAIRAIPGNVHLTFEEGTQATWLYEVMHPHVAELVVCNPRHNKRLGETKSDRIDAGELAERLRGGFLKSVYRGNGGVRRLKELVLNYATSVREAVRTKNRVNALYRARGIDTRAAMYRADTRDEWLSKLRDPARRFRASCLLRTLDALEEVRAEAERAMLLEARKHPICKRLQTIPGVGPIRAAQLVAYLETPYRFRTKRKLWSYAGLAVVTQSSADYNADGKRRREPRTLGLNRNYNRAVKAIFKGAAFDAAYRGGFKQLFQSRIEANQKKEHVLLTLARKIATIVLITWKTGVTYDPTKLKTKP